RVIYPRHAHVWCAAEERHILEVLWQHERPRFEHKDAPTVCRIGDEKMFCHDRAESAAANDNDVKIAFPSSNGLCGAINGFLQRIAEKPAHIIESECGAF